MQNICRLFFFILPLLSQSKQASSVVDEFKAALDNEKFFVVLFTKECCDCTECLNMEGVLKVVTQEIKLKLAKVVQEKELFDMYGVEDLPTVMFIRNTRPILYTGRAEKGAIMDWISDNSDSYVKLLTDVTFEHITQVSSGATTGDWITFFTCITHESCQESRQKYQDRLHQKMNTAMVNISRYPKLGERFLVKESPTIIFFRHERMYNYNMKKETFKVHEIVRFCEINYKNFKAAMVPPPQPPLKCISALIANAHLST
ncbi:Thioredoxin domain-containing protein [Nymphon striatum]|nr:Thioredoxin domain-containing protein [Nymphon striatum]